MTKPDMTQQLLDRVRDGLASCEARGEYPPRQLRRWFAQVDRVHTSLQKSVPIGAYPTGVPGYVPHMLLLRKVMRLMSKHLPARPIRLARILPFDPPIGEDVVDSYRAHLSLSQPPPIVVRGRHTAGPLELLDGRHRVTVARLADIETLPAVFAGVSPPNADGAG